MPVSIDANAAKKISVASYGDEPESSDTWARQIANNLKSSASDYKRLGTSSLEDGRPDYYQKFAKSDADLKKPILRKKGRPNLSETPSASDVKTLTAFFPGKNNVTVFSHTQYYDDGGFGGANANQSSSANVMLRKDFSESSESLFKKSGF